MSSLLLANNEEAMAIAMSAICGGVAIIWIIAANWRKTRIAAYNARLKQIMLERGMSADEIERVIKTRSSID